MGIQWPAKYLVQADSVGSDGGYTRAKLTDDTLVSLPSNLVNGQTAIQIGVRPEKIRLLGELEEVDSTAAAGIVREVAYLGSVTRYVVELDSGETLVVVKQNLDVSAAQAQQQRGRRVRLAWRREDESELDINQVEEDR